MKTAHPLKIFRTKHNLSREDVAEICGKSRKSGGMVSLWENMKASPRLSDLSGLVEKYGSQEVSDLCRDWIEHKRNSQ